MSPSKATAASSSSPAPFEICAYDPWLDDEKTSARYWHDDAERLFCDADEVRVKVIDLGLEYHVARNNEDLANSLARHNAETQLILIPQEFSWGSLLISELCMRTVLQHLSPFSDLLDVLHTFGERTEASNESRGGFSKRHSELPQSDDCVYLLKCVEKHGREGVPDPWSIRQFAVYEQHAASGLKSKFLIINPSASRMLRDKLVTLQNLREAVPGRTILHLMMLAAAAQNWTSYVDWLESQLHPLTAKAYVNTSPRSGRPGMIHRAPIDMADMQNLQLIQDKLHQTEHLLSINMSVATAFASHLVVDVEPGGPANVARLHAFLSLFRNEQLRVKTMLGRAASVSALMQNLMSTRALETLHDSSSTTAKIVTLAQDDNKIMLGLSTEARKDGRTLKTITILTLAYLPASFVSTLLSMGYINVSGRSLQFKPEMIIFGVLTIILLLITFGLWFGLNLRQGRREARRSTIACNCEKSLTWQTQA